MGTNHTIRAQRKIKYEMYFFTLTTSELRRNRDKKNYDDILLKSVITALHWNST